MYYYIYDSFLDERKECVRLLSKIETQINNLGLTGERARITSLKKVDQLVRDAAEKKHDPIVIVGSDETFSAAANILAASGLKSSLAFVPVNDRSIMGSLLGVTPQNAITILSRRTIKQIPLARANGHYFLSHVSCRAEITKSKASASWLTRTLGALQKSTPEHFVPHIMLDAVCTVHSKLTSLEVLPGFSISKLRIELNLCQESRRGLFHKRSSRQEKSIFWPKHTIISCQKSLPVWIDGRQISRTPLDVSLTDRKINLIVGPHRRFV